MKRLNKNCELSAKYKEWIEQFENDGRDHPAYSSSHKYYLDVVMNLFHCQGGLCAYTEILLCDKALCDPSNWQDGRYRIEEGTAQPELFGDVEHFDCSLKKTKGWRWANLFMVDSNINTRSKGTSPVDPILKPDDVDYDPFKRLRYNVALHIFLPKKKGQTTQEQDRIEVMLLTLGINHSTIRARRKACLTEIRESIRLGVRNWDDVQPIEFPTAIEMVRRAEAVKR